MSRSTKRLLRGTGLVALGLVLLGLQVDPAVAAGNCDRASGNGVTIAISPFQFAGSVDDMIIGGVLSPAQVLVTLLDMRPTPDGTLLATTRHVYEFGSANGNGLCDDGEDCFETLDHTVLDPSAVPGRFRMNEVNYLMGGTGAFAAATGKLSTHGWLDGPAASWRVRGRVCR